MIVFWGCTKFVQALSHSAVTPPVAYPSTWRLRLRFNSKVAAVLCTSPGDHPIPSHQSAYSLHCYIRLRQIQGCVCEDPAWTRLEWRGRKIFGKRCKNWNRRAYLFQNQIIGQMLIILCQKRLRRRKSWRWDFIATRPVTKGESFLKCKKVCNKMCVLGKSTNIWNWQYWLGMEI